MKRRGLVVCLVAGTLLGVISVPTSALAGGATTRYHLAIKTVDGESAQGGKYRCHEVITTVGAPGQEFPFTVTVVNAKGKRDTSAGGTVTAGVLPVTAGSACGLQSLNTSSTEVLYHATVTMTHGVATFTALNAAAPGYYVIGFQDGPISYPDPPWVLLMVSSPSDPTAGAGATDPSAGS